MSDLNPYESPGSLPSASADNQLPLNFIFSALVALIAVLLSGFLLYTGVFFGFQWPGTIKSAIAFLFLLVCIMYGIVRCKKDLSQLRELTGNERHIGIVHIVLIVAFCFAVRGFVHWVTLATSF
jgi:hypothetical protein